LKYVTNSLFAKIAKNDFEFAMNYGKAQQGNGRLLGTNPESAINFRYE